jgi:hypothetical protein
LRELRNDLRHVPPTTLTRAQIVAAALARASQCASPTTARDALDQGETTMTIKAMVLGMLAVVAMTSIGCAGSAQVVRRGRHSGELALQGAPHASMDAAQLSMLEHCGGRVRIVDSTEASALRASDPGIAKAQREVTAIDGERLYYVCVTLAASASR